MKMSSIKRAIHNGMGILLLFLLVIFTTSCTGQEFQNSESMQNEQTTGSISTEETTVVSEELEEEKEKPIYEDDEIVNKFIVDYNAISQSPITDIQNGSIKEKCYGHTYDHRIEVLNGADSALHVKIGADFDHPEMEELRDAFRDIMLILDPSISEEEAYAAFDLAKDDNTARSDMTLGKVSYNLYWTVEFSDGSRNFGRIEAELPLN